MMKSWRIILQAVDIQKAKNNKIFTDAYKSKMFARGIAVATASAMAALTPFAGVGAYAAEEVIEITQNDVDEAINKFGKTTDKGLTFTNEYYEDAYELVLSPGNYKLGSDIAIDYTGDEYISVYYGDVSLDLNGYDINDAEIYIEDYKGTDTSIQVLHQAPSSL